MSGHTPGPMEVRAVLSESPMELCAATIHGPDGAELGCTWRRVDDPPGAAALPGIENALLWAAAPELADALLALLSGFTGDDVRLLAVGLFGSKVGPEIHEKCDRLKAAHETARAALKKAGRMP